MKKQWIPGYEGRYEITDDGQVLSHSSRRGVKAIGTQGKDGYMVVGLCKDGKSTTKTIHRLVAEAFLEKVEGKEVVDHINEDKTDNRASNLRWCTAYENTEYYCTKDGRRYQAELQRQRKKELESLVRELRQKERELRKEIQAFEKEKSAQELYISKLRKDLAAQAEEFASYKKRVEEKLLRREQLSDNKAKNYDGYKSTKGCKFDDKNALIASTGKRVVVNGDVFPSCGSAASWIAGEEATRGNICNKDTISKELRRFLQGKRAEWYMYGRYYISAPK